MVKLMNFEEELKQKTAETEAVIASYLPKEEGAQRIIMEAMNYSLLAGGKRLRPVLMSETFRLFGGTCSKLLEPFMAAIEMIHTYSLVHDDLPAMDNDDYRRGRKTTHVVYGEAMGILAGDGLLNYAFETAFKALESIPEYGEENQLLFYQRVAKALQILAGKAGIHGMIGGQVIDMEKLQEDAKREQLDYMYRLKTGGLIEASMIIGAILAGAVSNEIDSVKQIAADIGLAFQIKDDILDVTSTPEVLGKPICSDEKNKKITYITLLGVSGAESEVREISKKAVDTYVQLGYQNDFLLNLIKKLVSREY